MGQVHDDGAGAWCSLRWLAGSWLASAAFLGAACKVGPDYEPPEPAMPDAWHHELVEGLAEGETGVETWWRSLNDPQLDELIQRAARGNLDLERAFARIKEARAFRGVAKGEYYPDLDGTGAAQRQRLSEGLQAFPGGQTDNVFSIGAEATWEIDVWGRIGRSVESADATLMASIENYRDVLVLLYADVALNYVDLRTLQARITTDDQMARGLRVSTRKCAFG